MNNQQWQEGKTYQFKPDMIEEFKRNSGSNPRIARIIGGNTFTVSSVSKSTLRVLSLLGYCNDNSDIDIEYWFTADEIKYFDLVDDTTEDLPTVKTEQVPSQNVIVAWLNKLQYVVDNDNTVGYGLMLNSDDVIMLSTDFGDITGASSVHNFITNRYDLLQQEAKHKKNNELIERKAKLEAELAEVVALLEGIK